MIKVSILLQYKTIFVMRRGESMHTVVQGLIYIVVFCYTNIIVATAVLVSHSTQSTAKKSLHQKVRTKRLYTNQVKQCPLFRQTKKNVGGFRLVQSHVGRDYSPSTPQAYLASTSALDQQNPNCCHLWVRDICLRSKRYPCLQMPAITASNKCEPHPHIRHRRDGYVVVSQIYHHNRI